MAEEIPQTDATADAVMSEPATATPIDADPSPADPSISPPAAKKMRATVVDEDEEMAAEVQVEGQAPVKAEDGSSVDVPSGADGVAGNASAEAGAGAEGQGDVDMKVPEIVEDVVDPNKLPDDACETLYIQNLNEKVRISGECSLSA
jgi:hypothetical protein